LILVKRHKTTVFLEFKMHITIADVKTKLSKMFDKNSQDMMLLNSEKLPFSDAQLLNSSNCSSSYTLFYLVYRLSGSEWEDVMVPPYDSE
jgi:hypothetical protein